MLDAVILYKFYNFTVGDAVSKIYPLLNKMTEEGACVEIDFINAFYKAIPTLNALGMSPYFEIVGFDENTISFKFRYGFMDTDVLSTLDWDSAVEIAKYIESQLDNIGRYSAVDGNIRGRFDSLRGLDDAFRVLTLGPQGYLAKYGWCYGCLAEEVVFMKSNLSFGPEKQLYLPEYVERCKEYINKLYLEYTPCPYVSGLSTFLHEHIQSNRVTVKKDFGRNTLVLYGVGFKDANSI